MNLIIALCLLCGCVAPHACRSVDPRDAQSQDLEPFVAHHHHEGNIAELLIPLLERSLAQNVASKERHNRRNKPGKKVIQVLPYRGSEEHKRKGWRKLNSRKKQVVEITPLHGKNRAKPLAYILSAAKPSHAEHAERNDDVSSMSASDLEHDKFSSEQQSSEEDQQALDSEEISPNTLRGAASDASDTPSASNVVQSSENVSSKESKDLSASDKESSADVTKDSFSDANSNDKSDDPNENVVVIQESAEENTVRPKKNAKSLIHKSHAKKTILPVTTEDKGITAEEESATAEEKTGTAEEVSDTVEDKVVTAEESAVTKEDKAVTAEENVDTKEDKVVTGDDAITVEDKDVTLEEKVVTAEEEDVTAEDKAVTVEKNAVTEEGKPVTAEDNAVTTEERAVTAVDAVEEDTVIAEDVVTAEDKAVIAEEEVVTAEDNAVSVEEDAVTAEDAVTVSSAVIAEEEAISAADKAVTLEEQDVTTEDKAVTAEDLVVTEEDVTAEESESPNKHHIQHNPLNHAHPVQNEDLSDINNLLDNLKLQQKEEESNTSPEHSRSAFIENDIVISHGHHDVESAEKSFSKLFNARARDIIELIQSSVEASTAPHRDCNTEKAESHNHDHKSYRLSFLFNK